jgi:MFS family permease
MSLYQTLYFMSLVGGMAGLFSWTLVSLISALLPTFEAIWVADLLSSTILGGFIGGLTVGFTDRWAGSRVLPRYVVSGALIGIVAGLCAGLIQIPITNNLGAKSPLITRVVAWMLAGSLIGLGVGLRWAAVNRMRAAHAFAGGLLGGVLGGLLFAGLGSRVPDLSQAMGFVLTGVGICFGITLAPILLRDGVLQFISSGDPRAQSKFGHTHKEWELADGDTYAIGSQAGDLGKTRYRPEVEIFVPDAAIGARHATLFGRERRFYIARHPDAAGEAGMARYVLRVRGQTVTKTQELRHNDDLMIGRTALRFVTRKKND